MFSQKANKIVATFHLSVKPSGDLVIQRLMKNALHNLAEQVCTVASVYRAVVLHGQCPIIHCPHLTIFTV